MDDLLSEFLTETSESLSIVDVQLVQFEQDPTDTEILGNIFRLVHTIKGTCGFLGLPRLESVAHAGENVLGKFRDGDLKVSPEAVTLILKCIDVIRDLLGELEESGTEGDGDDKEIINALNAMADGGVAAAADAPAPAPESPAPADGPTTNPFGAPVAAELLAEVMEAESQGAKAATDKKMKAEAAAEAPREETQEAAPEPAPVPAPAPEPEKAKVPAVSAGKTPAKAGKETRAPKESSLANQTIRVNVELLENLMTLVSEMVLTRNQLMQMVRGQDDNEFTTPLQRLSLITTDLQEGVMKTRMQPIGNAWAKLPRIVRDLSVEANKKIDLQMLGAETELDRQVLELIKDPLTHMVRNSADHGLESPDERLAAGKSETGVIKLEAFHEGGHIVIRIADDGRGLNVDRIKEKIIQNELVSEAELEGMTEQQIQQFIFKAGFSTAEKVTSVSGRGVGMDVVRTNIEKIGGTIELKSVTGEGSTFTIKIPLTLAIVSALIIESANQRFAIPQISVVELVRASAHSNYKIELINESPVLRLRNRLLPLINLRTLLKLGDKDAPRKARGNGGTPPVAKSSTLEDTPPFDEAVIKLVQETFAKLESGSADAGADFYKHLFDIAPDLKPLFTGDMKAQGRKLMTMIKTAVSGLDDLDALIPALQQLGQRHHGYGVKEDDYETVGAALLWLLEKGLGEDFTDEARDAWFDVYNLLARVMTEAAEGEDVTKAGAEERREELFIVVTQVGTYTFGIIVDRVFDTEEIVVKPVAPILREIPFYSGNTILGDGSVIMILDPNGIATATGQGAMSAAPAEAVEGSAKRRGDETTSLLIFRTGGKELKAVPLALIARLEEIDMETVEFSQGSHVVQYRGHLMPLVPVNPDHEWKTEGRQPILVFTDSNRSMGLVVDEIVDIVEDRLNIELPADADGLIGSAVIDGKATDILDAGYYLTRAFPDWFGSVSNAGDGEGSAPIRILLVDDSPFFRNLLTPLLSVAGYDVTSVDGAAAALKMRDAGVNFDAIISDIEMPGMNGFEFAEAVRGDPRWKNVPLVALSSHATEQDFERGREGGFNDYVAKFDREALIRTMAQTVSGVTAVTASK